VAAANTLSIHPKYAFYLPQPSFRVYYHNCHRPKRFLARASLTRHDASPALPSSLKSQLSLPNRQKKLSLPPAPPPTSPPLAASEMTPRTAACKSSGVGERASQVAALKDRERRARQFLGLYRGRRLGMIQDGDAMRREGIIRLPFFPMRPPPQGRGGRGVPFLPDSPLSSRYALPEREERERGPYGGEGRKGKEQLCCWRVGMGMGGWRLAGEEQQLCSGSWSSEKMGRGGVDGWRLFLLHAYLATNPKFDQYPAARASLLAACLTSHCVSGICFLIN
jgi:hypothetical protein